MKTYVFCGPSLDATTATRLRPDAIVEPPIRRGDLMRLTLGPGDTVVIIDGYFFRAPAIQHMEILDAIERGATVYGAASLGALRAAELDTLGMIGVGAIYGMYTFGTLWADDEVCVLHDPDSYELRSDALVNLRHNLASACRLGLLSQAECDAAIEAQGAMWFGDRSRQAVVHHLRKSAGADVAERVAQHFAKSWHDKKHADALEALRIARPLERPRGDLPRQTVYRAILREEYAFVDEELGVTEWDVLDYARLFEADIQRIHRRAALVDVVRRLGGEGSDEALERACYEALVVAGLLRPSAPPAAIDDFIAPAMVHPGQPRLDFLKRELERRGDWERLTREVCALFRSLRGSFAPDVVRFGRVRRDPCTWLYGRLWRVAEQTFPAEVAARGFVDLEHFADVATRLPFATRASDLCRARTRRRSTEGAAPLHEVGGVP